MSSSVTDLSQSVLSHSVDNAKAVLLVGGLGTRLRSIVPSKPKPLASVGNTSFLELLIRQLRHQGIHRVVMCSGYLAEQIESNFGDGRAWQVAIEYSKELSPLGTAGALKLAAKYLEDASDFVVMNGDSFMETDFRKLIKFHRGHAGLVTIAVVEVGDAGRYGTVRIGLDGKVNAFLEKTGENVPGLINSGVYVFNRAILEHIPDGPASLERDVFPKLIDQKVYALPQEGLFIDIGTPEDYARAQQICDRLNAAASG
jgi:D-glycero-alpha-D-manno-heptose 1-phosphate guanylyltransferase